jgi:hypothetical protein
MGLVEFAEAVTVVSPANIVGFPPRKASNYPASAAITAEIRKKPGHERVDIVLSIAVEHQFHIHEGQIGSVRG